jgi:hypothetical protein
LGNRKSRKYLKVDYVDNADYTVIRTVAAQLGVTQRELIHLVLKALKSMDTDELRSLLDIRDN